MKLPVVLTVAGSDSGGGAGIQADLKTFAALGCHGTSAIAAVTVQSTRGVSGYLDLPPALVRDQMDAVVADLAPRAAKTGMLASTAIIEVVAEAIEEHRLRVVVDPVMVAKGGHQLLHEDAVNALRDRLLPAAAILTPNLPEAEVLLGRKIHTPDQAAQAARDLVGLGCHAAVVKGGHAAGGADDVLYDGTEITWLRAKRVETPHTHGSGCVFSAAIAAGLAQGLPLADAVARAKRFISGAIQHALALGGGHGPVNPMWEQTSERR